MRLFVDGNLLANRCRHSPIASLRRSDGTPTGIIFGCIKGVDYARKTLGVLPQNTTIVWDGGLADWRLEIYPGYKAKRREARQTATEEQEAAYAEFKFQIQRVREGLKLAGYRQVRVLGCEADDIISLLAHFHASREEVSVISSSDQDFHHIVSDMILLFDAKSGEVRHHSTICRSWSVQDASDILRLRAMIGDSSDDIGGVVGVGPVRAQKLLPFLGTDGKNLPKTLQTYLREVEEKQRDVYERNLRLMRLPTCWEDTGYTAEQGIEAWSQYGKPPKTDWVGFASFCKTLEFESLLIRAF